MVTSLIVNRDRGLSLSPSHDADLSEPLVKREDELSSSSSISTRSDRWKHSMDLQRYDSIHSLDSTKLRFASRMLQKFPFLVEMFYWALNLVAYSTTKKIGAGLCDRYGGHEVTEMAQDHGIAILNIEHNWMFSIFFPVTEVEFQHYLLKRHVGTMTFFNQIYSLVHIPGTIAFLSWYYYIAPNHDTFATVRRTMTLGNFAAFSIFIFYPCMPPRLLPESFGFKDTVRQEHAESVWVGGANVNQLAAMPSLHFTYAFIIGCTLLHQSGLPQRLHRGRGVRFPLISFTYVLLGILYPILVLSVIIATANHYYLDAVGATFSVAICFLCNRVWLVLLPMEDLLLRILRVRKPRPSTRTVPAPEQSAYGLKEMA